jgi:hypothetical protein
MANLLSPVAKAKFFANNGKPAAGYKLFTYEAGTNTKADTFPDANTSSPNPNPIILDFRGEADVWIPPNTAYKFVFSPPNDTDPPTASIWTVDDIVDSQLVTLYGGVDTGFANAYVIDFVANFTAYADGIAIFWIPSNTNTGPSTINVNGLGPVAIINQDGSPLYLGQLQANQFSLIIYKGTGFNLIDFGLLPTINTQNADYTFAIGDANNIVLADDGSVHTWTVPANATVAFPIGTTINLIASPASITLAAAGGVTLKAWNGDAAPFDVTFPTAITKIGTNTWQQVTPSYNNLRGSFTGTLTGMTASTTGQIDYIIDPGGTVWLSRSGSSAALTGTSNTTAMTLTGLPASIHPKFTTLSICSGLINNGAAVGGAASISSAGVVGFDVLDNPLAAFTAAGTKGLNSGWKLSYPLF